jgi:DNA replication protein DnaC
MLNCDDCGIEYDGTAIFAVEAVAGFNSKHKRFPHHCPPCAEKWLRAEQVEQAANHRKRLAYQTETWTRESGLPQRFTSKGFSNFDATGNEARVAALEDYAETFPVNRRPTTHGSLVVAGMTNGIGKTHLAVAVLRTIIGRSDDLERERCPYLFITADALKHQVADAQRFSNAENLQQVYARLAAPWLLVVDDVGKEGALSPTDRAAVQSMYFALINDRYNHQLPLVLTSNLGFEPWTQGGNCLEDVVGRAGASRLREMCGGVEYVFQGDDRR